MKHNYVLKSILGSVKDHLLLAVGLLLSIGAAVGTGLLPPLVLEKTVDLLTDGQPGAAGKLPGLALLYFGLFCLAYIIEGVREVLITLLGQKVIHGLRSAMCRKLSRLPANEFITGEPGVTVSRIIGDVGTVETLFTSGLIGMLSDVISLVGVCAAIAVKAPGLAILLVPALPLVLGMTLAFRKMTRKAQSAYRAATAKASGILPETVRNRRTVRTAGSYRFFVRRYGRALDDSFDALEKSNFCDAVYSPLIMLVSGLLTALCLLFAARTEGFGALFRVTPGTAAALIAYIGKVFGPIQGIGMEIQSIQTASAGIRRIEEFLGAEEAPPFLPPQGGGQVSDEKGCATGEPALSFSGVTFAYNREKQIFRGFSFAVAPGETVTLTGRTGAGKSTVFRLLLGLYGPAEGKIRVNGRDPAAIPEAERRSVFGYVEQNCPLIPGTVLDQVTLGDPRVTREQAQRALRTVGLLDAVNALPDALDTPMSPGLFSQGQCQLLSIARATVADPQILLLDEITANLDSATEAQVLDALTAAAEGRTILSVSHRLYEHRGRGRIMEIS